MCCSCCGWDHHWQCGILALTHFAPSLWQNFPWSGHWDGQQFREIVSKPATAASSLNVAEDLLRGGDAQSLLMQSGWHPPWTVQKVLIYSIFSPGMFACENLGHEEQQDPEVMGQLCSDALLLQSEIQQRRGIPYGELNKDFPLGQKFCLEGFAGTRRRWGKLREWQLEFSSRSKGAAQ